MTPDDTLPLACFPCGCILDAASLRDDHVDYIECPWCWATFDVGELYKWMRGNRAFLTLMVEPGTLVRSGDLVCEVVDRCKGCGDPIGVKDGARVHLYEWEVLRN